MKIGIFDSGIGGLSVLHYACKAFDKNHYLYYADKKNVPYGTKTKEEVITYTKEAVEFLIKEGAQIIIIACNTATSVAIQELRDSFDVPILGMEPAVKIAVEHYHEKRILVSATPITVNSTKVHNLIKRVDTHQQVDLIALPKLVTFAESYNFDNKEVEHYLVDAFKNINFKEYSSLVLGCTHFNYFKSLLRKLVGSNVHFVDGNQGVVHHLMHVSKEHLLTEDQESKCDFYYSSSKVVEEEELSRIKQCLAHLEVMYNID